MKPVKVKLACDMDGYADCSDILRALEPRGGKYPRAVVVEIENSNGRLVFLHESLLRDVHKVSICGQKVHERWGYGAFDLHVCEDKPYATTCWRRRYCLEDAKLPYRVNIAIEENLDTAQFVEKIAAACDALVAPTEVGVSIIKL